MDGKTGELRPSQLITTYGPGSIVDLPDLSVIICGINHWNTKICEQITEPRLYKKLGVSKILAPPIPASESSQGTLPAYLFPNYLVCPDCRRLAPSEKFFYNDDVYYCHCEKRPKVFPARFIVACNQGHIDDFPWHYYVHKKKTDCPEDDLRLNDLGTTGAISDIEVECKTCKSERNLNEAFSGDLPLNCSGKRPWIGARDRESCSEKARAMLRGASNLYFPVITSALVIPPYHDPLHMILTENEERFTKLDSKDKLQVAIDLGVFPEFANYTLEEMWSALQNLRKIITGPEQDLLYPEWKALLKGLPSENVYDFEVEKSVVPEEFSDQIAQLIMVKRLAEVRALNGFTRINPPPDITSLITGDEEFDVIAGIAPLSARKLGWIPGIMTRGEGIFVALKEETLNEWERNEEVRNSVNAMEQAYRQYCDDRKMPVDEDNLMVESRYILLHTLSHMLIRQLCVNSGYSSTALRERIYASSIEGRKMAGLLIYTATPDSEGSLGGLVELGLKEKFGNILWQALQEARFCSGDPLCSEHLPEALGDINGASCHACLLAAETSCECSNRFLDRSFLVPTISTGKRAFFI